MSKRPTYPPRRSLVLGYGQTPRPVVAVDIDGTLGDYHLHFWRFAQEWLGRELPDPARFPGGSLARYLGMTKETYRKVKLSYRQGGQKRSMPVYPGAAEMTARLRTAGAEVWVCTTRPYLRLDNIDPDTRHWLRRNGIQFDGVLFGERKYRDLCQIVGAGRVVGVLDDLPEMYDQAKALGLKTWVRDQPYNRQPYPEGGGRWRVRDLYGAATALMEDVHHYEEAHRG